MMEWDAERLLLNGGRVEHGIGGCLYNFRRPTMATTCLLHKAHRATIWEETHEAREPEL